MSKLLKLVNNIIPAVKKHKKISAVILVMLVIVVYIGIRSLTQSQSPSYQTARAQRGTLVSSVSESGQVSAVSGMVVNTQASGTVSDIFVSNGSTVSAGDKIAELSLDQSGMAKQAQSWSSYLTAKNNLDSANAQLNTLQSAMFKANQTFVTDRGVINPSIDQQNDPKYIEENADWLAAEADYKNQQSVIAQAQAALSSAWLNYQQVSSIIYAPISGTISSLAVQVGSYLAPSSSTTAVGQNTIATIATEGMPVISVSLSEVDAPKVKVGDNATITLDAFPNKTFTGKVQSINTQGIVTSGVTTYPATIALDTSSPDIYTNMSATANIITETKDNVILVPTSAIQTQGTQSVVRVLKNGQVNYVPVEIGGSSDTQTEILSGLNVGDEVITGVLSSSSTTSGSASPFGLRSFGGGFGGGRGGGAIRLQTGGR